MDNATSNSIESSRKLETQLETRVTTSKCRSKENCPKNRNGTTPSPIAQIASEQAIKTAITHIHVAQIASEQASKTVAPEQASNYLEKSHSTVHVGQPLSLAGENHVAKLTVEKTGTKLHETPSCSSVEGCIAEKGGTVISKSPLLSGVGEGEDWADVSGSELFCEVAQEMDRWEREFEQVGSISEEAQPPVLLKSRGNPLHVPGASAHPDTTPLRSQFVAHVAPVTLLPPGVASGKLGLPVKGFYGVDKEPPRTEKGKMPRLPGASPSGLAPHYATGCTAEGGLGPDGNVGDYSPLLFPAIEQQEGGPQQDYTPCRPGSTLTSVASRNPVTVEETPPSEQGSTIPLPKTIAPGSDRSLTTQRNDSTSKDSGVGLGEGAFKTPNISRWLNSKRCTNSFSPSTTTSPLPGPIGGKITPPLCGCGRRAKRKFVCSPGPNEGLPFYVCPNNRGNDRKQGCNYFKWERRDCSNADEPLLSDYGECR